PRDDLHVAVRVGGEAGARRDPVVVRDEEEAVMRVLRVVVPPEAEAVPAVEPAEPRVEAGSGPAGLDRSGHRARPLCVPAAAGPVAVCPATRTQCGPAPPVRVRQHGAEPSTWGAAMRVELRPPILLDEAVDDPGLVERLVDEHQPYWPVQRYVASSAEYATLSGDRGATGLPVAPVFRGDWAVDGRPLPGVGPILDSARFADAARAVFGGQIVRPTTVYVNLTWQLPFPQGAGHTDIPAFRGFDRREHPVAFLSLMGASGLFEDVRVKTATAVSWFYRGADGGFEYWPDGPDAPSVVHEGAIHNTAVVADNDVLW